MGRDLITVYNVDSIYNNKLYSYKGDYFKEMKKFLIIMLTLCMIMSIVGCTKPNNTTTNPTTAPTEVIEPTENITQEPTIEPTVEPTEIDVDAKAEYYKTYTTSEDFGYVGSSAKLEITADETTLTTSMYDNYIKWVFGEQSIDMLVDGNKVYSHICLFNDNDELSDAWYVAEIPDGEDPLNAGSEIEDPEENEEIVGITDLTYIETVEIEGIACDKVSYKSDDGDGIIYVTVDTHKILRIEATSEDGTNSVITYIDMPKADVEIPENAEEIGYEDFMTQYSFCLMGLLIDDSMTED